MAENPIGFGPFTLHPGERLLRKKGQPVPLGDRALSMLMCLVERAGEVVAKRDLVAQVWPDDPVDDGTLRFHMSGLRKALGEGEGGARYIATSSGRGYCFVSPIRSGGQGAPIPQAEADLAAIPLPPRLHRMIGRDSDAISIRASLEERRFVTIVGPGGIGKTTVALAVAHGLAPGFGGPVAFADLGSLEDPVLVPTLVARAVGLSSHSAELVPALVTYLRGRKMLVVLDSCEHVIEAVASLAESIAHGAPGIHVLATSREPLGVGDELVYQLQPLPAPAEGATLDPSEIFAFPAVTLFLERVSAGGTAVGSSPRETQLLADIARKLEGIPLAIELTASRVQAFGLAGTAELLNERLHNVVYGRRTALPRHQTLGATLDWSYNLLPEVERKHLNRLAVFVGAFNMEAARSVADYEGEEGVEESVAQLVAKSLLTVDLSGPEARYRLLDTTRAYLAEKLRDSGEEAEAARRHAHCYFRSVEQKNAQRRAAGGVTRLVLTDDELGNIRAALQWSFGRPEGAAIAIPLAAAAVTFLVEMSLMAECRHWTERALAVLGEDSGTRRELDLQMVFANAVMFTEAGNPLVKVALERALELARALDQSIDELRILGALHLFHVRGAEHRRALKLAEAALQVAQRLDSPAALAAAEACVGMSNHLMGNHDAAPARLRSVLARTGTWPATIRFGMDYRIPAQMTLARHHWIEGKGDQAAALAQGTIERAEQLAHPVTHCVSLVLGIKVFLWLGDYDRAEAYIFDLITQAERRSLAPYDTIGRGLEGELNVRTGRSKAGIRLIEDTWAKLQAVSYRLMNTNLKLALAEGLAASGHVEDALGIVEKTVAAVEASGDLFQMPELLRLRGCLLERLGKAADGEVSLRESLRWAERQCALAWRLRSATSLAAVAAAHGRLDEARHVLAPVYEKFTEGFGSIDLRAAGTLLERLEIAA